MKYNMKEWLGDLYASRSKKAFPILSFPSVSLLGVSVRELISDSDLQAKGMKAVADKTASAASVSFMTQKLTIEAEEGDFDRILKEAQKVVSKIDSDCRIIAK